jgi:hypothetical protein
MQQFIQADNRIIQLSEIGVAERTNRGFLLVTFTKGGTQTIYPPLADEVWRQLSQAANPPAVPPAVAIPPITSPVQTYAQTSEVTPMSQTE